MHVQIVLQGNGVLRENVWLVPIIALQDIVAPETEKKINAKQDTIVQPVHQNVMKTNAAAVNILELVQALVQNAEKASIQKDAQAVVQIALPVNIQIRKVHVVVHAVMQVPLNLTKVNQVALLVQTESIRLVAQHLV